jgi:hypothetical protein
VSAAASIAKFLAAIGPELLGVGRALYKAVGGDPAKARRQLRSYAGELQRGRAAIDRAANRKFRRR